MSSIFSSNNSIPLIIFVFIFIGVGMFFLIQKTTEKEQNKKARQNSKYNNKSSGVNLEQKIIEESQNQYNPSTQNNNNTSTNTPNGAFSDNISNPFSDEVGLFIQRDGNSGNSGNKLNINKYAKPQPYIPPFGSGKETRCVERQVNRPHNTDSVQSTGASNLVKYSSDASY